MSQPALSTRAIRSSVLASERRRGSILAQTCAGLYHAHQLHIVHRDLKPENIMLIPGADGQDQAVVMDFGLAKENRAGSGLAKLTATGIILGTPEFMSPEQIRGKTLDARSDIYALGIVGFEMLTGKVPFEGSSPASVMQKHLKEPLIPPDHINPNLSAGVGEVIEVHTTDPGSLADFPAWAKTMGHAILETKQEPGLIRIFVKRQK